MSEPLYHLILAVIGLIAFLALLIVAVRFMGKSPGLAALSGGSAIALAAGYLYNLLSLLGSR